MTMHRYRVLVLAAAFITACSGSNGPTGPAGADAKPCTVTDNSDGTKSITCPGSAKITLAKGKDGATGATGATGAKGATGASCTVKANGNATSTITCGSAVATIHDGVNGTPSTCTETNNNDGTYTISCTGGTAVTIHDGAQGIQGIQGVQGTQGTAGTSCSVTGNATTKQTITCTDGTWASISAPIDTNLAMQQNLPGVVLTIVSVTGAGNADGSFKAGDKPVVKFSLANKAGAPLSLSQMDAAQAWLSGPTSNYQHVLPIDTSKRTLTDIATTSVANADGTYTYTFTDALPTNYPGPLHDTDKFGATDQYGTPELTGALVPGTYTVLMAAYKNYTINGATVRDTSTDTKPVQVGSATAVTTHNELVTTANCNQCHQTLQMHGGTYRDVNLCVTCHTAGAEDGASIGSNGAVCGNSGDPACPAGSSCVANKCTDNTNVTIEFKVMIHKLHNAAHLPSVNGVSVDGTNAGKLVYDNTKAVPYQIAGGNGVAADFSAVQFPVIPSYQTAMPRRNGYSALATTVAAGATISQRTMDDNIRKGVVACYMCHGTGVNGAVTPAPAGDGTKNAMALIATNLSRRACGSCHDDINWKAPRYTAAKSGYMASGAMTDESGCGGVCHNAASGDPVLASHNHPAVDQTVTPSPVLAITSVSGGTGPTVGGKPTFKAGDPLSVTYTIQDGTGANMAPFQLDAMTWVSTGPTTNRQAVFPYTSTTGIQFSPFDFSGRVVVVPPGTGNGSLFKVHGVGATQAKETLTLVFTSTTAFDVRGTVSGPTALGSGTLGAATSVFPSGASLANFYIAPTAPAGAFKVAFADASHFTVSVAGTSVGTGTLPASTGLSTSTRFVSTDGTLAFNVTTGTTAPSATTVWNGALVKTPANQLGFVVVAGSNAFGIGDRIYYDYVAPAATYTQNFPMELPVEVLGIGDGAKVAFNAANGPVIYGRQSVWLRTAAPSGTATSTAATKVMDRNISVSSLAGMTAGATNYLVFEAGTVREEYASIRGLDTPNNRVFLNTPLRWTHASGTAVQAATLVLQVEGVNYTLDTNPPATAITFSVAPPLNAAVIMTYRTNGTFGWKRAVGDTLQAIHYQPPNGSSLFDESVGNWAGKTLAPGTYTVAMFATHKADVLEQNSNGELQTYTGTSHLAQVDYLYGGATTVQPYSLISDPNACNRCHSDLAWHGAGRRGAETCLMCHGVAGLAGNWSASNVAPNPSYPNLVPSAQYQTDNFRTFLHDLHSTTFPAMPGGAKNCTMCHGTATAWNTPTDRNHPTQQGAPVKPYTMACQGCHNTPSALGHILSQAAPNGAEGCATCHAVGKPEDVTLVHKAR